MPEEKKTRAAEIRGAWAAYDPDDLSQVVCDSSEIKAFRHLNAHRGWLVVAWPYGLTLAEAIAKAASKPSTAPKVV